MRPSRRSGPPWGVPAAWKGKPEKRSPGRLVGLLVADRYGGVGGGRPGEHRKCLSLPVRKTAHSRAPPGDVLAVLSWSALMAARARNPVYFA